MALVEQVQRDICGWELSKVTTHAKTHFLKQLQIKLEYTLDMSHGADIPTVAKILTRIALHTKDIYHHANTYDGIAFIAGNMRRIPNYRERL